MMMMMTRLIPERLTFLGLLKRKAQKSPQASISLKNRLLYSDSSQVIGTKWNYLSTANIFKWIAVTT